MNTVPVFVVTGEGRQAETYKVIDCPVGKYNVKVVLSPTNEFLGIAEVAVNADFRSYEQKTARVGVHEVDEFYRQQE